MKLTKLHVRNFRLYTEVTHEFCPDVNLFYGSNAQGKTTLLEALHILMIGRSFRTMQNRELIRHGADHFYIEAHFVKEGLEQRLKLSSDGKERKIIHNHTEFPKLSQLIGLIPGIVMTPDDDLVKGPPHGRRLFLDIQISQADSFYLQALSRYQRALQHRNALLRSAQLKTIDSWEFEMAQTAAYLTQKRDETIQNLRERSQEIYHVLTGKKEAFEIRYQTKAAPLDDVQKYYLDQFQRQREREMVLGNTLHGPHRDEILLMLDGQEARSYGSEGQKRTCVAALRLAAWQRLKSLIDTEPLMLIDDMGSQLDKERQHHLLDYLSTLGQVFITHTESLNVPNLKTFHIKLS